MSQEIALIEIPEEKVLAVFTEEGGVEPYLAKVREQLDAFLANPPPLTTQKGRDEYASMSGSMSKFRTFFEDHGKALADKQKEIPKKIDATRKYCKDTLAAWRDEARQPLTDWETKKKQREDYYASMLQHIADCANGTIGGQPQPYAILFRELEEKIVIDDQWGEFADEGRRALDTALTKLRASFEEDAKRRREAEELEQLRAEKAERERKEQERFEKAEAKRIEEKAKADQAERERVAAENARIAAEQEAARKQAEADAKAKAEIEAAAQRERDAKLAQERAEREKLEAAAKAESDRIAAEKKAEADKQEAIAAERRRQEAEANRVAAEQAARERDTKHKKAINNAAVDALCDAGIDADTAKKVITLIAKKQVPNVSIQY